MLQQANALLAMNDDSDLRTEFVAFAPLFTEQCRSVLADLGLPKDAAALKADLDVVAPVGEGAVYAEGGVADVVDQKLGMLGVNEVEDNGLEEEIKPVVPPAQL
jgi:hypothetical protein